MPNIFQCALMILKNQCPPDPRAYLCMHGEEYEDDRCEECWSKYLFCVANGCKGHPYQYDLNLQKELEERKVPSDYRESY